jgi:hypothetical protein
MTRRARLNSLASAAAARITRLLNAVSRRVAEVSLPEAVKRVPRGGCYPACGRKFVRSYTYRHALPRKSL